MRLSAIVVVMFLGMQLARPALAQSGWDFSGKPPAAMVTTASRDAANSKETVVTKTSAHPVHAAKAPVAKLAPSHRAAARRAHPGRAADSKAANVHLLWSGPAAISHDATPVIPRGRVILLWNSDAADPASTSDGQSTSVAPVPPSPDAAPTTDAATVAPVSSGTTPTAAPPAAAPASAIPALAHGAVTVEPRKPQPTGLERLSDDWPKAIKVGVQYRGRAEEQRGSSSTGGRDDGYYLNRIRLEATVNAAPWLKGFVQMQDAQTLGYDIAVQPTSNTNTFDLRQGYVEAVWPAMHGFGVRVGRQDIDFGEQRLIGSLDWGNAARTFDAVRVFATQPGVRVDAFVSSVVVIAQGAFDRWKPGETISGTYVSLSRLVPKGVIEPFAFAKIQTSVTSELGKAGDGATYTFGARAVGTLPRRFDYGAELAVQRGHISTDTVDAWAGHYALGWRITASSIKPRLIAEFNNASGDGDPTDGRRQTFDQLYPTNHNKYGIADQMGWRNMRDAMVGIELFPVAKLKLNADAHRLFLATAADGLYVAAGPQKVLNRKATSLTVGTELDAQAFYVFSKELSLGAGVGTLVAGDYLTQATSGSTVWTPYVMWNIKF